MKKIILTCTALLLFTVGYAQDKCLKFKEGTFKVTDPKSKKVCIITREGDTQNEKLEESEEVYDFEIKWLDGCTYTLTPSPATLARKKEVKDIGTMTVKITQVKDSSYVHRVTVANNPKFRRVDEVFMVKK